MADREEHTGALHRIDDSLALRLRGRHRLLEQEVVPLLRERNGRLLVLVVQRGDDRSIGEALTRDRLAPIRELVLLRYTELRREFPPARFDGLGDADDLRTLGVADCPAGIQRTAIPRADDENSNRLHDPS